MFKFSKLIYQISTIHLIKNPLSLFFLSNVQNLYLNILVCDVCCIFDPIFKSSDFTYNFIAVANKHLHIVIPWKLPAVGCVIWSSRIMVYDQVSTELLNPLARERKDVIESDLESVVVILGESPWKFTNFIQTKLTVCTWKSQ